MLYNIADMKTNPSLRQLGRQIDQIKEQIAGLGPIHPGSMSPQYQVCGNPACKCMHPKQPQRHGPYYKLAYVYRGKPTCRFVRADCVQMLKDRLDAYKRFRSLIDEWIALSIQQGTVQFFSQPAKKPRTSTPSKRTA